MIVVADTSPLNYLLLINQIDLLPRLFQQIIIPDVVREEMLDPYAPPILQQSETLRERFTQRQPTVELLSVNQVDESV